MKIITRIVLLVAILATCFSFRAEQINTNVLQRLKTQQDYIHHIVFFSHQTYEKLRQLQGPYMTQLSNQQNIKFYINDCKSNPMKQCETKDKIPLMLLFNRVFIRFNGGNSQNQLEQIRNWIQTRIQMNPFTINNKQQLQAQLEKTPEIFCYCNGVPEQKGLFYSLSKAMVLTSYCVIENKELCLQLGLKQGNVTLFKNGSLEHRIGFEYQNRYDIWQNFLKIYAINHVQKPSQLAKRRFSHQNKSIDAIIVVCDLSYKCEQFWMNFQKWSRVFQQENPNVDLRFTFFDQKQLLMFNLYLHTKIDFNRFPSLVNIKLFSDNAKSGWIRRYISYPQKVDGQQVLKFIADVNSGRIPEEFLSGQTPQKNGFTGKGAEKLIQKVVAKNLNQTVQKSEKHFVLLLNTFGIGCQQCEQFQKQYKKAASFLIDQDVQLGYMNIRQNEVKIDNVQSVPQVILYNKYLKNDPSVMHGRLSFDYFMKFLQNNAIINYQKSDL